ncbi:unnamed protein product [Thelazia callipaeda]|uniref:RNA polymerase II-associated factor 1 homolog n=1 Tax=Thelazia callipaeda TaxID=103827 RepID=A0A0N5CJH2_THECL|nr:unnamed protein product [Thelazia callipaeda]
MNGNNEKSFPTDQLRTVSKFAGEEFGVGNMRTVFAGASKDNMKRKDRVILLIGSTRNEKSRLIDCMCNYFYGARFDGKRFKIADEIFDQGSTPLKSITKYVFNETVMPFRPVIIDTPEIDNDSGLSMGTAVNQMLHEIFMQNCHIHINAITLILQYEEVMKQSRIKDQKERPKLLPSTILLFSSSDEKRPSTSSIKLLLRYLNLNYTKYYFFNGRFLQDIKEKGVNDEEAKSKGKSSWNLTMTELDRFFEQVRRLNPQGITTKSKQVPALTVLRHDGTIFPRLVPDERMQKSFFHERIIPVKLISQSPEKSVAMDTPHSARSVFVKNLNLTETPISTPVIKRYVYDPKTMTHKEYIIKLQRNGDFPAREYVDMQAVSMRAQPITAAASKRKIHETLINDIPLENTSVRSGQVTSDENHSTYRHIDSSPPPDYGIHSETSENNDKEVNMESPEKRTATAIDMDPYQKSQYPKSAVQRQIARRTSGGFEYTQNLDNHATTVSNMNILCDTDLACSSQQEKSERIQTEQVVEKLEDGILSAKNIAEQSNPHKVGQELRGCLITSEIKRSKSPIQMRLTKNKKQQQPSLTFAQSRAQPDDVIEQARIMESSFEQGLQSPLRNFGRVLHEDEVEEQSQEVPQLVEEEATATKMSTSAFRTQNESNKQKNRLVRVAQYNDGIFLAAGNAFTGRLSETGTNQHDYLLGIQGSNLEEGLERHPYQMEPR